MLRPPSRFPVRDSMFSLADEACALAGSSFNTFPHLEKALALYNTTSGVKPWWLAPTRDKLRANGLLEDSERWAVSLPDHWPILRARASVASVRTGKVGPAVCLQLENADGGDTEEHLRLGLRVSAARPLLASGLHSSQEFQQQSCEQGGCCRSTTPCIIDPSRTCFCSLHSTPNL